MGADTNGAEPENAGDLIAGAITSLMKKTGIPNGLSEVGYNNEDLELLVEGSFPQKRLIDNAPTKVDGLKLFELYKGALRYW